MAALAAATGRGQDTPAPPPPLKNDGKPIPVPLNCTAADVQWAGVTCTASEPCSAYLEISAVEKAGDRILAAGNIHSVSVTLFSLLLASDDDGRTWSEAHERIRGSGLSRIQFAGPANGWISGEELFPMAQNPFLLATADGGKTWRRLPVFDEPRAGSVEGFRFTSASNGILAIGRGSGRHDVYQSQDGGATWEIKEQTSKPPDLNSGAPPPAWRARADAATRSFQIEQRDGERWTSVAAFNIQLGACKPDN